MHNELLQATCNKEFEFTRIFLERRNPPPPKKKIYIYMYVSVYYIKIWNCFITLQKEFLIGFQI